MKEYHESLVKFQNVLLSFGLIDGMKDEKNKVEVIQSILKYLLGSQAPGAQVESGGQKSSAADTGVESQQR